MTFWRAPLALALLLTFAGATASAAEPALIAASKAGDLGRVEQLLASGADPDSSDQHRNTALIFAARDGRLAIARALLAAGASVNWLDGEQVTPLILAAHKNHPALARLLLDQGADPDPRDQWGRSALDYAQRRGQDDAIAVMLGAANR